MLGLMGVRAKNRLEKNGLIDDKKIAKFYALESFLSVWMQTPQIH
jgi:hypothetical protein